MTADTDVMCIRDVREMARVAGISNAIGGDGRSSEEKRGRG